MKFRIKYYRGRVFNDPLEENENTLNVTMFKFKKIICFSKRTGEDKYEVDLEKHNFIIPNGREVLKNTGLDEEDYLELLLSKTKDVQDKLRYNVKDEKICVHALGDLVVLLNISQDEELFKKGIFQGGESDRIEQFVNRLKSMVSDGYKEKNYIVGDELINQQKNREMNV